MAKEVIWTDSAKKDLQEAYEFNIDLMGEKKGFELIKKLVKKADVLYNPISGGTRYISHKSPEINYQKLVAGHFIIIYREEEDIVYVNRIFDSRQDPKKLDL